MTGDKNVIHKYEGETIVNGMRQPPRTEYDDDDRPLDVCGVPLPSGVQDTPEARCKRLERENDSIRAQRTETRKFAEAVQAGVESLERCVRMGDLAHIATVTGYLRDSLEFARAADLLWNG